MLASLATTDTPQGVCVVALRPMLPWDGAARLLLVLDGLRDPGNLGTLVRSAAAAGCGGVVLVGSCVDPWSPKALRSAMGATLRLPFTSVLCLNDATAGDLTQDLDGHAGAGSRLGVEKKGVLSGVGLFAADAAGKLPYHEVCGNGGVL